MTRRRRRRVVSRRVSGVIFFPLFSVLTNLYDVRVTVEGRALPRPESAVRALAAR